MATVAPPPADASEALEPLRRLLDGEHAEMRERVREWLSRPGNVTSEDRPLDEYREQVMAWARELAAETMAFGDLSLLVKLGVQFGLFGGAVLHLGTERHHERYLRDIASLRLPGCFAMTETGHGSNVQALGTTATYDPQTQTFDVHTPDDDARKDYIGNAARDGRMAAVFAQLDVGGENRGVHALLVPIRDDAGDPIPGVRIEDCGD